jgi:hypothetical protein
MIYLGQNQLLDLWWELVSAYHGKNGFGGNVCELYIYTGIGEFIPGDETATNSMMDQGATSIYNLLIYLKDKYDPKITILGSSSGMTGPDKELGDWFLHVPWNHRIQVKIEAP